MGKARRKKKTRSHVTPVGTQKSTVPNWPLLVLALLGMGLTGYLTFTAWAGEVVAGCAVGSDCDIVLSSRWATLFGQPTAFWGFLTYLCLAAIAWMRRRDLRWKVAWQVALFGVLYSVYLTTISMAKLQAACPYCLTSAALMITILGVVTYQRPTGLPHFSWRSWLPRTAAGSLALVLALHLHHAGAWGPGAPEDPELRALAIHLSQTDAKFYGAFWCPHCEQQKRVFGTSADRLPYIECSPGGRYGPVAEACGRVGIRVYPTWIINGRRYEGVLTVRQLAARSGFAEDLPVRAEPLETSPARSSPANTPKTPG